MSIVTEADDEEDEFSPFKAGFIAVASLLLLRPPVLSRGVHIRLGVRDMAMF
jgi:hypothetical protein